ncbi:MAG: Prenyltransferase, UbiA family [Candidatus Peregrinibacteria bacterium GW2011_GWC2_39_14]|nr:MAG: Prenyltransferase, UbiA family [Candidatus Peregrinibacteria bacterium GW2011_GWC2_39_14]
MRVKHTIIEIFISMRPKQWTKNFFIFAALIFVKDFLDSQKVLFAVEAFVLFCFASSAVYIMNDVVDIKSDREHPTKKYRPLAAVKISPFFAIFFAVILATVASLGGWFLNTSFFWAVMAYLVLQLLYSFWLKRIVIIDVLAIALGFVIRVIAGAVAISVSFSVWLILCTFFLALFLAISKRRNELLHGASGFSRGVLQDYTLEFLNQMNMVVLPSTIITYAFYTFSSEHSRWLMVTIPIVVYGLFRYLFITDKKRIADNGPSDDILGDAGIQVAVLVWIIVSGIILIYGK